MASHLPRIRPLVAVDAPACDAVIASLPYHFGNEDGRRECAEGVRSQAGLVAVEGDRVVGFLTVVHHFPETSEITWMAVHADHRTRAFYRSVGFVPARELPDLWPGNKALLLAMPL